MNKLPRPSEFGSPNFAAAERFLAALDPAASAFTFQTFDDLKRRGGPSLGRVLHGALTQRWAELCSLNTQRAGVCVTVNATDLKGRRAENITRLCSIWQEDDGGHGAPGDGFAAQKFSIVCTVSPQIRITS